MRNAEVEQRALRLLVYDRTCTGARPGLSDAWREGARLYRALGRLDGAFGASNWSEALDWLITSAREHGRPIGQIQYWGHGRRGVVLIDRDRLDRAAFQPGGAHRAQLDQLRAQCTTRPDEVLWWFRTCETFGGQVGHEFARAVADHFSASTAGHTYVIGFWQSGLHRLAPGASPHWSPNEGLRTIGDESAVALPSSPRLPHTLHCLQGSFPSTW